NLNTSLTLGSGVSTGNLALTGETINLNAASIDTSAGTVGNATFTGAVSLQTSVAINTAGGGTDGNVTFVGVASTINGTTADTENLSLTAGTGNVSLGGAAGGTTRLGNLSIASAADVSAAAITAKTIKQMTGTGTTTFNGALDTDGVDGVSVT